MVLVRGQYLHQDRYIIKETLCTPNNNFALSANGWGTFSIPIKVFFKNGQLKDLPPYELQFRN